MSLAQKTIGNALAGVIGFVWPILLSLFSLPYIVNKLGNDSYGVLAVVTSVLGFLAFLDLGVTSASVKYVAEAMATEDTDEINRIVGSSLVLYIVTGGAGALLLSAMATMLVERFLKIPASCRPDAVFAFYVAAGGFFVNMVLGVFASIPKAVQRFRIITKVNIFVTSALTLGTIAVLSLGYGLREVIILNFMSSLASLAVYFVVDKRLIRGISFRPHFHAGVFRKLFSFGMYSLIVVISSAVLYQLDRLMIASFAGAAEVAFYVVPSSIALRISSFVASMMGVVFPLSSELYMTGQTAKLQNLYLRGSKYALMIGVSLVVPLCLLSTEIMHYWMGGTFGTKSGPILACLAVSSFFASLTAIPALLLDGVGKPRANAFFALLSAVFNVSLCLLLIPRLGVMGAAYASLANGIIVAMYLVTVDKKILHIGLGRIVKEVWRRPLMAAFCQGLFTAFVLAPHVSGIVSLLMVLALSCLSFYAVAIVVKAVTMEEIGQFRSAVTVRTSRGAV